MKSSDFKAGEMVVIKQGHGFYDLTSYPYGGSFHRATSAFGVRVVGPGGKYPDRELIVDSVGKKLCVNVDAVVRLLHPSERPSPQ